MKFMMTTGKSGSKQTLAEIIRMASKLIFKKKLYACS
jgi:hypothetical protein